MRQALKPHPDFPAAAVTGLDVDVARDGPGSLMLAYTLTGALADLVVPPRASPARTDELWRHTCFEAFLRTPHDQTYFEFNFAPSGQWAAYRFDAYRAGMSAAFGLAPPHIEATLTGETLTVNVGLDLSGLADLPADAAWRLGLSAVIEAKDGGRSYWALAHPPGQPDFHHPAGFVHDISNKERA
jgi:hypothetical protein